MESRTPITDSLWFWVLLFSGMAFVALVAMGPKYGGRQARLEQQYQARERIAAQRAAPGEAANGGRRDFATPEATLIELWPLAVVIGGVSILAAAMLVRERRRQHPPGSNGDGGARP